MSKNGQEAHVGNGWGTQEGKEIWCESPSGQEFRRDLRERSGSLNPEALFKCLLMSKKIILLRRASKAAPSSQHI